MANGLVIHIESASDKHTEVLTSDRIVIGTSEDCDIRLRKTSLPFEPVPAHLIELERNNSHYQVVEFDRSLQVSLNEKQFDVGIPIEDGDTLRVKGSDLSLQFFPIGGVPQALARGSAQTGVAPFMENAALESAATARRDDAKVFLREFTRELVREISVSTKIVTMAIAVALVGGVLYLGFGLYKELVISRRSINDQRDQITSMQQAVGKTNTTLTDLERKNGEIITSMSLAPKIRTDFGSGVCLISGSFYFVDGTSGRPLRYPETQPGEDGTVAQSGTDTTQLTPDGNGGIAEFEFVGSGFYVGDGFVLTNRHVAQPWLADERAQSLSSTVKGQPRLKKLVAFFPGHNQEFALKFKQAAAHDDLAVCSIDPKELPTEIPVLPLDKDSDAIAVGKAVVMMGYPSGPDRLLALLDDAEARSVQAKYGSSLDSLLTYLASKNRIQPLMTQGHITDLDSRRIVYDARTAEGGSGAPLFGTSGRVIGINFAVFTENTASNFAVPARAAEAVLLKAGWKPPEPVPEASPQNGSTNQNGNRNATVPSSVSR